MFLTLVILRHISTYILLGTSDFDVKILLLEIRRVSNSSNSKAYIYIYIVGHIGFRCKNVAFRNPTFSTFTIVFLTIVILMGE